MLIATRAGSECRAIVRSIAVTFAQRTDVSGIMVAAMPATAE
jgi:hypothetical protein